MSERRGILRTVGSLWFGAVLLMLLLVAMAAATVFESTHSAEHALAIFYKSWWFKLLLGFIGLNVLTAVLARYPFSKRQIGFIITHSSILLILAGAWVTEGFSVDGQVGLAEGQTVRDFRVGADTLTLVRAADQTAASVNLPKSVFSGFDAVERPSAPALGMDGIAVSIDQYLPDSAEVERMVDDNPHSRPAVEVSLSPTGKDDPTWLLTDRKQMLGPVAAAFRSFGDAGELERVLAGKLADLSGTQSVVKVAFEGGVAEYPLQQCVDRAVQVRDTGFAFRVLRYLPHATVGQGGQIHNVSDKPVNPAIEVEITGPEGARKQLAFARFPDFKSMHGGATEVGLTVTLVVPGDSAPTAPVEVLGGPGGALLVRFSPEGRDPIVQPVALGTAVQSPWPGSQFAVLRRFEHARSDRAVEPVEPVRKERAPAVLVRLATQEHENRMWLQKDHPYPVTVNGQPYTLTFGDRIVPLGFALTLDKFHLGTYPGERRPRSFESHITIEDAASGRTQSRVISMNHPTQYGGYTFYQSSYRQEGGHSMSFLSVSRDPGQPIVFAGYIGLMGGMVTALSLRIRDRRRMARLMALAAAQEGEGVAAQEVGSPATAGKLRSEVGSEPGAPRSVHSGNGRPRRVQPVTTRSAHQGEPR